MAGGLRRGRPPALTHSNNRRRAFG